MTVIREYRETDKNAVIDLIRQNTPEYFALEEEADFSNYLDSERELYLNPEKPDVPLNKNDAFQKVQKRRVQEKR